MAFTTELLATVYRGSFAESEHRGAIAVVDGTGHLIAYAGDPDLRVPWRSSAKPFQALPVVESGASAHFGFLEEELAIMTGSHAGTPRHIETVRTLLKKIGMTEASLQCGAHKPFGEKVDKPLPIHNNCSGKHAGMLALANFLDKSTGDYLEPDHPIQLLIHQTLAEISGIPVNEIGVAVDGCSAPTYIGPLHGLARAFARLAAPASDTKPPPLPYSTSEKTAYAIRDAAVRNTSLFRVVQAMIQHPECVGGDGRIDTELMKAGDGALVAKGGAEGVEGMGVLKIGTASRFKAPLGIAVKIADGEGRRALLPVVLEALRQMGVMKLEFFERIKKFDNRTLSNHRGRDVGRVETEFQLRWV